VSSPPKVVSPLVESARAAFAALNAKNPIAAAFVLGCLVGAAVLLVAASDDDRRLR
jgi:hypothetical protein